MPVNAQRTSAPFRDAPHAQTLRVYALTATAGVYSFTSDQVGGTLSTIIFSSYGGVASASRTLSVYLNNVANGYRLVLPAGSTSLTGTPATALPTGTQVRVKVRGSSGTQVAGEIVVTGPSTTRYLLLPALVSSGRWVMVGGVWTPVQARYIKASGTVSPSTSYVRAAGVWTFVA